MSANLSPSSRPGYRRYGPTAEGWIDTSSASKPKKPTQRPLVAFRNSFATPPSTVRRSTALAGPGPSTSKRWTTEETAKDALQSSLSGYLTPPTTRSAAKPRAMKLKSSEDEVLSHRGSPLSRGTVDPLAKRVIKGSRLKQPTEDFWGSDDSPREALVALDVPRYLREDHVSRSVKSLSPLTAVPEDVIDLSTEDDEGLPPPPPPLTAAIPSSHLNIPSSPSSGPHRSSSLGSSSHRHKTPSAPTSDPPQITQVPEEVLELHKRICGQDTAAMSRIKSPWRKPGDVSGTGEPGAVPGKRIMVPLSRVGSRIEQLAEINLRAVNMSDGDARNPSKGKSKELVRLSDEEVDRVSPPRRVTGSVLSPLRTNLLPVQQRRTPTRFPKPGKRLSKTASRGYIPPLTPLPRTSFQPRRRSRSRSISVPATLKAIDERIAKVIDFARGSPDVLERFEEVIRTSQNTPSKATSPYHHVTPPKSRTPTKRQIQDRNEMMFAFAPPPQPQFVPLPAQGGSRAGDWDPIAMDPETLITWSIGREGAALDPEAGISAGFALRPIVTTRQNSHHSIARRSPLKRARSQSEVSTNSIAPSVASQSFPRLIRSSPESKGKAGDGPQSHSLAPSRASQSFPRLVSSPPKRITTRSIEKVLPLSRPPIRSRVLVPESSTPRRSPRLKKEADAGWRALETGILSANPESAKAAEQAAGPASSVSTRRAKVKKHAHDTAAQSKLAAFGFFGDPKMNTRHHDFEQEWDAEEDLDLDEMKGAGRELSAESSTAGLHAVPDAPYHPHLRPAGIRELRRREAARAERPAEPAEPHPFLEKPVETEEEPPLFPDQRAPARSLPRAYSTDTPSSLTTSEAGPQITSSTGNWWARIGNRRSSDSGSLS